MKEEKGKGFGGNDSEEERNKEQMEFNEKLKLKQEKIIQSMKKRQQAEIGQEIMKIYQTQEIQENMVMKELKFNEFKQRQNEKIKIK